MPSDMSMTLTARPAVSLRSLTTLRPVSRPAFMLVVPSVTRPSTRALSSSRADSVTKRSGQRRAALSEKVTMLRRSSRPLSLWMTKCRADFTLASPSPPMLPLTSMTATRSRPALSAKEEMPLSSSITSSSLGARDATGLWYLTRRTCITG
uniref:Uncharacterized protein n=1 Tax=Oryza brachyantha TaxID=4533 RepID=J3L288_ORYBR